MGGKFFFNAVREGDEVKFATEDENERHMWVQALYRATGQSHKPVPPKQGSSVLPNQGGDCQLFSSLLYLEFNRLFFAKIDADRAKKHGMDEFIGADPVRSPHDKNFSKLQTYTLEYRLNDPVCSLVIIHFARSH